MKPILLTVQAFGPYADRQEIDFREAMQSGLFGIYGQTGAGKSSIFSAMTFALFGESAKAEQMAASLRSDHADPKCLTEVEFIFDLGPKRYYVRRRPEQMRPKDRGEGATKQSHEAWLFDATGIAPENISVTNPGTPLAERKVGLVEEALCSLLGYGAEQFRQIILLPQGRFETFLSARTDARLEILRELFDVSLYKRLTDNLKREAADAVETVRTQRQVIEQRLVHEGFESFEALDAGIVAGEALVAELADHRQAAQQGFDAERKALDDGKAVEGKYAAVELARTNLERLEKTAEEIKVLKLEVADARRAESLQDIERQALQARADVQTAGEQVRLKQMSGEAADTEVTVAATHLEGMKANANEIELLRQDFDALLRYEVKLSGTAALRTTLSDAQGVAGEKERLRNAAMTALTGLKARKDVDTAALSTARSVESQRTNLTAQQVGLERLYQAALSFEQADKAVEAAKVAYSGANKRNEAATEQSNTAKAGLERAEEELAATQALHLAAKLADGEPCPVCGSGHHPHPAVGEITHEGLDSVFRAARTALDEAQAEEMRLSAERAAAEATLKERQAHLDSLEKPGNSASTRLAELTRIEGQIGMLPAQSNIDAQTEALSTLEVLIVSAEGALEMARQVYADAERDRALAENALALALAEIPEAFRSVEAVGQAKLETAAALDKRIQALAAAEQRHNTAKERQAGAIAAIEAALRSQADMACRCDREGATFEARLMSAGLNAEQYAIFKGLIPGIAINAQKVEQYEKDRTIAEADAVEKARAIEGLERPELEMLTAAERTADATLQATIDAHAQQAQVHAGTLRLKDDLQNRRAALTALEAQTAELRELAGLFSGGNVQRTDLETFAIGAMFDQVLNAANLRLRPMTSGRYSLERDSEGSGSARRGLGIRVIDTYTGKGRAPATLSGGETFICALALALGLSDVVESATGKIRLDTIFIDEGFGSLDTEDQSGTLDQVLQVLTNLAGHRRSVGIISHVPQVQEMIPNGFYVRKGLAGSVIEQKGFL